MTWRRHHLPSRRELAQRLADLEARQSAVEAGVRQTAREEVAHAVTRLRINADDIAAAIQRRHQKRGGRN